MSKRTNPREFAPFTIPEIVDYFAEGEVDITFLKEEPQFFFISFPRKYLDMPIPIAEIPNLIESLSKVAVRAEIAEALERAESEEEATGKKVD